MTMEYPKRCSREWAHDRPDVVSLTVRRKTASGAVAVIGLADPAALATGSIG